MKQQTQYSRVAAYPEHRFACLSRRLHRPSLLVAGLPCSFGRLRFFFGHLLVILSLIISLILPCP